MVCPGESPNASVFGISNFILASKFGKGLTTFFVRALVDGLTVFAFFPFYSITLGLESLTNTLADFSIFFLLFRSICLP